MKTGELPYKRISFSEVINNPVFSREFLKDKIVLVGTMTREDSSDYAFTPYNKEPFLNPKIALHANILDSVIQNNGIIRASTWLNWAFTFATSAFVLWWVLTSTPLYGLCATLCLVLAFMIFGQVVFAFKGLWIRESQPLIAIFLSYYLVVPYRLIREYKKRWDYQKKHELLVQVEELKTNFLNLVTHDLKTPVARIQGLIEVLQRQAADRLTTLDREYLGSMLNSTEELNRFITMLLELNKVESNLLQLQLESKDINNIVEQAIERYRSHAENADIKIILQLEPLFPIKFDVSLLSKVLANLIDNALKYSNKGTEITISTREVGSWVEIKVKDQGIGLSDQDLDSLFTRFYRSKVASTKGIAGTGLGLYLTKYFVEAHEGEVSVESKLGEGSVFTIKLPLTMKNSHTGLRTIINSKKTKIPKEEKYV
jgi:signal transduction histidine kinase